MIEPYLSDPDFTLYVGDVRDVLRELPAASVDCVVTSPPYWGLRDYGTGGWDGGDPGCDHIAGRGGHLADSVHTTRGGAKKIAEAQTVPFKNVCGKCGAQRTDRQIGLEATPQEYVATMVEVFREVRQVLAPHGTVWLNLGDSYVANGASGQVPQTKQHVGSGMNGPNRGGDFGLASKNLVGIPWRTAFALQDDGWYLRSDIIWAKPNPMPESVTDRPTKAHEYVFLLAKQPRYFFDQEAVREPAEWNRWGDQTNKKHEGSGSAAGWISTKTREELNANRRSYPAGQTGGNTLDGHTKGGSGGMPVNPAGRNIRSVWTITTQPYADAHFATFPEELPRRAILAGCPEWVCRTCGKPRERLVESESRDGELVRKQQRGASGKAGRVRGGTDDADTTWSHRTTEAGTVPSFKGSAVETVGWSDCGHNDYRPGVVLDPFIGSGTTAYVARNHGRHTVGVELNPEYAALIGKRTQQQSLLS